MTARDTKRGLAVRLLVAAATIGAALALAACGAQTIDSGDLEAQLAEQLSAEADLDPAGVSVSCPDDIEAEEGHQFECILTANGDDATVEVTLTDDEGGFRAVLPPGELERDGATEQP
jgi:hypothetical protein